MKKVLLLLMVLGLGIMSSAAPVFFDDFNTENGGAEALNYLGFANWIVSDGTVDLIGNGGTYDFLPGHGLYVDMDGSTGDAGKMFTSQLISLQAGTYKLSYKLAGNQRNGGSEQVNIEVNLGSVLTTSHSLLQSDPFQTFVEQFTLASAQNVTLSFEGVGGDNIGMLRDDVKLEAVPAPGAILLGTMGTGLVGWLRRRRSL
jgi:hypothetical protein